MLERYNTSRGRYKCTNVLVNSDESVSNYSTITFHESSSIKSVQKLPPNHSKLGQEQIVAQKSAIQAVFHLEDRMIFYITQLQHFYAY